MPEPAPRTVQHTGRDGIIDLGWGHPHPAALPVEAWPAATAAALRTHGGSALAYGHGPGPAPFVEWLRAHLATTDARAPDAAEVFVTAGASHALELVATLYAAPGDAVLVDAPTYHLALRILADRDVRLVGVPAADPGAVAAQAARLRAAGHRVRLLYLVPTFGNPTGASLPGPARTALLAVAAGAGLTVVEDDTYRELAYDGPAPASLWSTAAPEGAVIRIGSFAKTVAPGLRLGFLTAAPAVVRALAERGYVDSGGGVNHTVAMTMAAFGAGGGYDRHVEALRRRYRDQRDALVGALRVAGLAPPVPAGGWFLWLPLPPGRTATGLLPRAEAAGVSFLPGRTFFADRGSDTHLRLSYSMLDPPVLAEAASRLGTALAG